jgi:hypothetical protein
MREDLSLRCPSCGGQAMFGATKLAMGPFDVIPCMKCEASLMLHRRPVLASTGFFQLMLIVGWVYADDVPLLSFLILLLGIAFLLRWIRHRVPLEVIAKNSPVQRPQAVGWRARVADSPSPSLRRVAFQIIAIVLVFVVPATIVVSTFFWPRGALPIWIGAVQHIVAAGIIGWAGAACYLARR